MTEGLTTEAVIRQLEELLAEVWAAHRDKGDPHYNHCEDAQCAWCDETHDVIARLRAQPDPADVCGGCGGPYRYDVSIPSVLWNRVIRAHGGSEYLCATCILQKFALAGVPFTAELSSAELNGVPIEVIVDGETASTVREVNEENNALRVSLRAAESEVARLRAQGAGQTDVERLTNRASRLEDAAFHFQTCRRCKDAGEDACQDGRQFAAFLRGELDGD